MIRTEKQKKVEELQDKIAKAKYCVFTEYRGLNVENINILRTKIREVGGEYHVVKNTLTGIASKKLGLSGLESYLKGPTAIAFGYKDETAIIKVLIDFSKKNENFKIKVGVLDGASVIDDVMLNKLSKLPSREVLLSQLVSCLKGPLFNLANVLQANLQNMVSVVNEIKLKKEKTAV
ncbi:MAG: 50S ribosomal protein L10 [bacterium]|nr:50S ribosomal protein L10 [bacterium]